MENSDMHALTTIKIYPFPHQTHRQIYIVTITERDIERPKH